MRKSASVAALVLAVTACGGDDDAAPTPIPTATATAVPTATATAVPTATAAPTATATPLDFAAEAADFDCILDWEPVRTFRITNKLGFLAEAVDLAENPVAGSQFPVGTIIQLFPGEAMVKRGESYDPANNNWEYFELDTSSEGTTIRVRGRDEVVNRFGAQCFGCHAGARDFDFICETDRGCVDLGIPRSLFETLQNADPRCAR